MDEAVAAFDGTSAVIVDVTYNLGGFDGVSRKIAGRFAGNRKLAYTKVAHGAHDVAPQPFHVEPSERPRYLGPVVLVTSDVTVSAGEIFTLLHARAADRPSRRQDNARRALRHDREAVAKRLVAFVAGRDLSRRRRTMVRSASGIPPQLEGDVFPADDLSSGHARHVAYLIDKVQGWFPKP